MKTIESFFVPKSNDSPELDDEQQFIDYFSTIAKHPNLKSGKLTTRRVAVFGKSYGWGQDVTFLITKLPVIFRKWCASHGFHGFNSIVVNVYDDTKSSIAWHGDDCTQLAKGETCTVSFAMRIENRKRSLSSLEFRWPKKGKEEYVTKYVDLKHGTVVTFDAKQHARKKCQHRVEKTKFARVSITFRKLF